MKDRNKLLLSLSLGLYDASRASPRLLFNASDYIKCAIVNLLINKQNFHVTIINSIGTSSLYVFFFCFNEGGMLASTTYASENSAGT